MKQIIFLGIFFLIVAINFGQTPNLHSYAIANGTSQCITEHGETRYVTNVSCGATIFISALTPAEWTSFYTSYPTCVTVSTSLVNCVHTSSQCTAAGGTVVSNMCQFNLPSCSSVAGGGWTQYGSWSTTTGGHPSCTCTCVPPFSGTHTATYMMTCTYTLCSVGGHIWGNTAVETTTCGAVCSGCSCPDCCGCTAYATINSVGCY